MYDRRFKFHDAQLQHQLIGLMRETGLSFSVGDDGAVRFSSQYELQVDDAAVEVRDSAFGRYVWHVCNCEPHEVPKYIEYMESHGIRYVQESDDEEPWFLLERKYDPEDWGIW